MIEIDGISIIIERKNIKNMYIRISPPNGEVKMSVPFSVSDEEVFNFAKSKINWITKKVLEIQSKDYITPLKYKTGEKHLLWGKEYFLKLIPNEKSKKAFIQEDTLFLPVKKRSTIDERQKALIEFYRDEIKLAIPPILANACNVVGKSPNEWRVKNMKTRWGTCNINKKRIWINLQLAKKPPECLEYVIYHELTHLHVANHSIEFKDLLNKFYPNSNEVKNILNKSKI